jgi:3-oxoacyl-[acyl-carrier-protein] synthase-1
MTGVSIVASGAVTAVGFNARATWCAVRAGVSGVQRDNLWDASGSDWMQVARPHLWQWWEGPDMLAELAAPAIQECLDALPAGIDPASVPVVLLLEPVDRPFHHPDLGRIVSNGLVQRLPQKLSASTIRVLAGRCGLFQAVRVASQWFRSGQAQYMIICGVDTFLRQRVADAFDERRRLHTARNSNGFIPGEAACAVLLAPDGERPGALRIAGAAAAREPAPINGDEPCSGDGLTEAMRTALAEAGIGMADTAGWLNDQNAEHYKAKECTVAQIRLERRERPAAEPYRIWHPIEYLGEIGSAIGPALFGVAHAGALGGWMPGARMLMSLGEDDGERAAFVLFTDQGEG